MNQSNSRTGEIIRVSLCGIAVNLILVVFKTIIGLTAHSIAVILDAVNNLSDALSSIITIIGAKLAGKAADRKHPYGHGRIEYISASLIALLVLLAGFTSMKESIVKLVHPAETRHTILSLIVLIAAVAAKLFLGRFYQKKGAALNSDSLKASGMDALYDAVISFAALISAIVSMTVKWNLEGWLGIVISVFIIKAGCEIITETLNHIIGIRADDDFTSQIKASICEHPAVHGAYDLILHNYGPDKYFGSVHVELDDNMSAREIDALTRSIVPQIYQEYGVLLTIGIYAANTHNDTAVQIRETVRHVVGQYPEILQMHGFYMEEAARAVSFDILVNYDADNASALTADISSALTERFPDYHFFISVDHDFSE